MKESHLITQENGRDIKKAGLWTRVAATAAGTALLLTGCSVDAKPEATSTSVSQETEAPIEPTETSTPAPTPTSIETKAPVNTESYKFPVDNAKVEGYIASGKDAIVALPLQESVEVLMYYANELDLKGEADTYAEVSGNPNNKLADEISVNNTIQEIVAEDAAIARMSVMVDDKNNPGFFDPEVAEIIALTNAADGYISQGYATSMAQFQTERDIDGGMTRRTRGMAATKHLEAPTAISGSELYTYPNTDFPAIDIQVEEKGVIGQATFVFVTASNGASMWIQK